MGGLWGQVRGSLAVWQGLIIVGFLAGAVAIVASEEELFPWTAGQRADRPIAARLDFQRVNQIRTVQERESRRRLTPNVFRFNRSLVDQLSGDLNEMLASARAFDDFKQFVETSSDRLKLDEPAFDALRALSDEDGAEEYETWVNTVVERLKGENLVKRPTNAERDPMTHNADDAILIREDGSEDRVARHRLSYVTNEEHVVRLGRDLAEVFPPALRTVVIDLIVRSIRTDPAADQFQAVYVFDRERTIAALDAAGDIPPIYDHYKQGDVLVPAGTLITAEMLDILLSEHQAYLEARQSVSEFYQPWMRHYVGEIGIALMISIGLWLYVLRYQTRVIQSPVRCFAVAVLLLGMLAISRLLLLGGWSEYWTLATTTTAAAILTIAYSQRFALGVSSLHAFLTTLAVNGSFELLMVLIVVNATAVFLLSDVRSRFRLIEVGLATAASGSLTTLLVGLMQRSEWLAALGDASIAAAAALLAMAVVLILLPVIERAFGIATSMTLLEWADTSTPLLKQLIQKAPGTWQHSHLLGSMSEAAADEVGANGLLVRVGAYYHDIGKMCKPEYFVENQPASMNIHSRLAPRMSLLVILGHVKDGLALAREYRLPPVLHQFIAEHHGSTVVRYFHAKASGNHAGDARRRQEVDETDFRYPGPRPRSKESAILMLCDSVEGKVRSLSDPTPGRIESVVHDVVMERLLDGQLDDCDITLKELSRIEQSLVRSLCSIYHGRIAYPKAPEAPAAAARQPA
jgi:putative nucleotidyltransferase with HDIG domain